jgi:hypothetical protein
MNSSGRSVLRVFAAILLGFAIALVPQGVWSALILLNLRTTPAIPWSVIAMACLLWTIWRYLGGRWWPRRNARARRRLLRANAISQKQFGWSLVAGLLAIFSLDALWIVLAHIVRMPGSVLPDMSAYPRLTTISVLTMAALVSPICEQEGLWGYCQTMIEGVLSGPAAIAISAIAFALLPHPPMHAPYLPKLIFFLLVGGTFGTLAYLTNSILPGLVVHIVGIVTFFLFIWPYDPMRPLLAESGAGPWFWIDVAQVIVLALLALFAFGRLSKATEAVHGGRAEDSTGH